MRHWLSAFCLLAFTLAAALPAGAVTLLRDPDIEHSLKQLAKPVLAAAGLPASRIKILVVDESTLNAFIVDRDHIFIHSGLLLKLGAPEELQAVIAHEAAHMANGHLARRPANARAAQSLAGFGLALAAAAAAAGNAEAGAAIGIGIQSSAMRSFFAHTRAEEASADQSSIRYLTRAKIDPMGAVRVMKIFEGQELVSAARQDPYARSHPLSRDRARALEAAAAPYKGRYKTSGAAHYWFHRAKGKLSAFKRAPKWTLRRAGESGHKDIEALRKAVAWHRSGKSAQALSAVSGLIKASPKDPYLRELLGQFYLEQRQFGKAVTAYKGAAQLAPNDALILAAYGRALLVSGNPKAALPQLERAVSRDRRNSSALRDLGSAYAQLGRRGLASLATAERYAIQGRLKDAGIHAKRALGLLKRGSPGWQRAQDVFQASEAVSKSRRKK